MRLPETRASRWGGGINKNSQKVGEEFDESTILKKTTLAFIAKAKELSRPKKEVF
jgi:hypothetical protein